MKISIITACFNSEATIRETLNSVKNQHYPNIEHVMIDGASRDHTLSVIAEFPHVSNLISEKDKGIYDAMNKGVRNASGEVIGILNSDDLYVDNDVLSDVMDIFINHADIDIVYGNIVYVKRDDTNTIIRKWISRSYYDTFFENGHVPPHSSLFVRRSVYEKAGLFELKYKLAADYEFMLRIFKKNTFRSQYLNRMMVKMRLGGATNKSIRNIINGNREILLAWKENGLIPPFSLMPMRIIKRVRQFF